MPTRVMEALDAVLSGCAEEGFLSVQIGKHGCVVSL